MVTVAPLAMMAFAHGARLIAIVDALPAMTTPRPYQAVRSISDAMRELECGAGTHLIRCSCSSVSSASRMLPMAFLGTRTWRYIDERKISWLAIR